jgi:tol-pal system protein YbgF
MVHSDLDGIKTRLFSVEKDLGAFRDESKAGIGEVEKGYKADVEAVRKLVADVQATIDGIKTEMQALNGKMDDMTASVKKPEEDLARYRDDADKRIIALDDRLIKLQTALDDLTKKVGQASEQKKGETVTPESVYTKGMETLKAGDLAGARDIFAKFLEQYPHHDLAGDAQFWIGDTYYNERNYEPAILAYQEVIKQYPNREKVPAAMLKQALCFRAIKDVKSARYVLKKLAEEHPKSAEAKKAREILKELK